MLYIRTSGAKPRLASLIALLTGLAWLTFASHANADTSVSHDPGAGKITLTGDAYIAQIEASYGGFSYTFSGDTFTTSSPACSASGTQITCAAGPNAVREIEVHGGEDDGFTALASIPRFVTVRTQGVAYVSSENAPLEAFLTAAYSSVGGSPTHDYIVVTSTEQTDVAGGAGDDQIVLSVPPSSQGPVLAYEVTGGDGEDIVDASGSTARIDYEASPGQDVFVGGSGDDEVHLGNGDDWAFGNAGNDRFYDDRGNGTLKIWGGPHSDRFVESDQNTANLAIFDGGPGTDTVDYVSFSNTPSVKNVTLDDDATNDGTPGVSDYDQIHPSVEDIGNDEFYANDPRDMMGDDTLYGSAARNTIRGKDGNDDIFGLGGADQLFGGDGADELTGGAGADKLDGGDGDDAVAAADGEVDTIVCGLGIDTVTADSTDQFTDSSCESVTYL